MAHVDTAKPSASGLTDDQRKLAMERFAVLQPHLENDVPLTSAATAEFQSVQQSVGLLATVRMAWQGWYVPPVATRMRTACPPILWRSLRAWA